MDASLFEYFFLLESELPAGIGVAHFSPVHLAWLVGVLFCCCAVALLFCRARKPARRRILCAMAAAMLLNELLRDLWLVCSGRFDVRFMLPLHLCGIMLFVESAAVFTRRSLFCELSYCLGMPGALFALLTPESTAYPLLNLYYISFIISHALLLAIPVLLLLDGFRPAPRRLPACAGVLTLAIGVVWLLNRWLGANYLFLNAAPSGSLLEPFFALPQPFYLLCAVGLLSIVWVLLYLPWIFPKRAVAGR